MRFPRLVLPVQAPATPPLVCVYINEAWLPVLISLMERLEFDTAWLPDTLRERYLRDVYELTDVFVNASGECGERCFEYPPDADFIEWFPHNPFTEPDLVTEGYNAPAWYVANQNEKVVMTDLSRFPPGSLPTVIPASGLPRFRVSLEGPATLKLHLLSIVAGSLAQITTDGDIQTIEFVDLNKDILSVPPETAERIIIEREIPAGQHYVDVIIVSWVNETLPFLHHGGGLIKVEVCGQGGCMGKFRLRQNDENVCLLEQSFDDGETWQPAFDYSLCLAAAPAAPLARIAADGRYEESDDGGQTWHRSPERDPRRAAQIISVSPNVETKCDAASSVVAVLKDHAEAAAEQIEQGAAMAQLVAILLGIALLLLGSTGVGALASPLLIELASVLIGITAQQFRDQFTLELWKHVACAVFCHISDDFRFDETAAAAVLSDLEISGEAGKFLRATIKTIWADGLTNAARLGIDGDVADCDCDCGWCYEYDFTYSQHGWAAAVLGDACAVYEAGYGWRSRRIEGGANYGESIGLKKQIGQEEVFVRRIQIILNKGMRGAGGYPRLMVKSNTETISSTHYTNWQYYTPQGGSSATIWTLVFDTPQPFSALTTWLSTDAIASAAYYPIADDCFIQKIRLYGDGNCPFGEGCNCE